MEQDDFPLDENYFDVVIFTEIFEHLRINPLHTLRESFHVLKPGGTFILSIPNITPIHRCRDDSSTWKRTYQYGHEAGIIEK